MKILSTNQVYWNIKKKISKMIKTSVQSHAFSFINGIGSEILILGNYDIIIPPTAVSLQPAIRTHQ